MPCCPVLKQGEVHKQLLKPNGLRFPSLSLSQVDPQVCPSLKSLKSLKSTLKSVPLSSLSQVRPSLKSTLKSVPLSSLSGRSSRPSSLSLSQVDPQACPSLSQVDPQVLSVRPSLKFLESVFQVLESFLISQLIRSFRSSAGGRLSYVHPSAGRFRTLSTSR